jgi:aminoglycoside 6-adenylyltransferase
MDPGHWDYEAFESRIADWAAERPDIRAAIVYGSRARDDRPADRWSDIDVVLVTTDADPYVEGTDWLADLGDPLLSFHRRTPVGEFRERHVLFEDGLEADLVPISLAELEPLDELSTDVLAVLSRGYRAIVDKDGLADALDALLEDVDETALTQPTPTEGEFVETVHQGWYWAFWSAKKLRREELWTAKWGIDVNLKQECLLPLLRWHAQSVHDREVWHLGRFLEEWADSQALTDLPATFATYDGTDCWRALCATMELFRWVGQEAASDLDYPYPEEVDERVSALVTELAPEDYAI